MTLLKNIKQHYTARITLIGDVVVYLLATVLGFISHAGESEPSLNRMAATFVPFLIAWIIVAPWLGAYDPGKFKDLKFLWRPVLACLYAAPIGAFGRSLWLGSPAFPMFVLVMAGVTAGLMLLWRWLHSRLSAQFPD